MEQPGTKARIDLFNKAFTEGLKDDNFKLTEREAIIYDNIDDVGNNNSLGYLESNVQNMNSVVEYNAYDDNGYCWNTNSSTTSSTLDFLSTPSAHQARRLFV